MSIVTIAEAEDVEWGLRLRIGYLALGIETPMVLLEHMGAERAADLVGLPCRMRPDLLHREDLDRRWAVQGLLQSRSAVCLFFAGPVTCVQSARHRQTFSDGRLLTRGAAEHRLVTSKGRLRYEPVWYGKNCESASQALEDACFRAAQIGGLVALGIGSIRGSHPSCVGVRYPEDAAPAPCGAAVAKARHEWMRTHGPAAVTIRGGDCCHA